VVARTPSTGTDITGARHCVKRDAGRRHGGADTALVTARGTGQITTDPKTGRPSYGGGRATSTPPGDVWSLPASRGHGRLRRRPTLAGRPVFYFPNTTVAGDYYRYRYADVPTGGGAYGGSTPPTISPGYANG